MATILIADDQANEREALQSLLEGAGYRVCTLADGATPETLAESIDLIVSDRLERVAQIRACARGAPVILQAPADHVRQARRLAAVHGVSLILPRPARPEDVLAAVAAALSIERGNADAPAESAAPSPGPMSAYHDDLDALRDRLRQVTGPDAAPGGGHGGVGEIAVTLHAFTTRLAALLDFGSALLSERDADALIDVFCRRARDILACRRVAVGIIEISGTRHCALAARGYDADTLAQLRACDPTGTVLAEMPAADAPLCRHAADPDDRLGLPAFHPPLRDLLIGPVPARAAQALCGWICCCDRVDGEPFDDEDLRLVHAMVAQFALAWENLTLYGEVRRHAAALEAEFAEHKMTALALAESEQRFRQIANHTDAVFFLVEPDSSRVHYVSPAYERIWGRGCAELYAQPLAWLHAIHPDDRQAAGLEIRRSSMAGIKYELEFRVVHRDGSVRWLKLRGYPVRNGGTDAFLTAGVAVDVTAAKHAERALNESNRRFTDLLDNVELVATMLDGDARLTYCNECFLRLTGWSRDDLIGCDYIERFVPPDAGDMRAAYAELLSGSLVQRHRENEILTRSGQRRVIRWSNTLLRSATGEVTGVASIGEDVTDQRHAERELAYTLTHDVTTGLPRFAMIEDYLQTAFVEAAARDQRVIVFYIDLDRFHTVNETRGRVVGDQMLRIVARRLRELARHDGSVAHVAGDEFAIVVKDPSLAHDQVEFGETIRARVEDPIEHEGRRIYLSCSVGVSCFPDNGSSPQEVLRQAESAMLRAKQEGRNTVFAFANEDKQALDDRHVLGLRLDDALRNGEFLLHFQPWINGQDWRVSGFEALLRWDSPEFGLLTPKRFGQVAEDLGMMVDIGAFVVRAACRQAREWIDAGVDEFSISINVSPAQMQRPNFVAELRNALGGARLPPRYIELEMTEAMMSGNFDRVSGTIRALKALGVKLSLDDFGTGYSSLDHLRRFPIDTLKIDRTFVHDITTDVGATGVCRAIITLAHQLGMTVLAEGVETAAQVGYLRRNDCDFFQGYYFCKPIPAAKAFELLQHRYLPHEGLEQPNAQPTLLLVDDEENILNALMRMLRRDGYRILTAKSAEEAFELLGRSEVQVIVSDQRMPGASGTEFLSKVKEMYPATVRMVLSGYTDLAAVTAAINEGAIYKFLTKPWNDDELRLQIRDAFRLANRPVQPRRGEA